MNGYLSWGNFNSQVKLYTSWIEPYNVVLKFSSFNIDSNFKLYFWRTILILNLQFKTQKLSAHTHFLLGDYFRCSTILIIEPIHQFKLPYFFFSNMGNIIIIIIFQIFELLLFHQVVYYIVQSNMVVLKKFKF